MITAMCVWGFLCFFCVYKNHCLGGYIHLHGRLAGGKECQRTYFKVRLTNLFPRNQNESDLGSGYTCMCQGQIEYKDLQLP